jgi:predicted TIM-barrel fold metal-dependent hydrolase
MTDYDVRAIDGVANIYNAEALSHRPLWRDQFFGEQMRVDEATLKSVELDEMLRRMDAGACDFLELKLVSIHVDIPWADEAIAMAWKHENVDLGSDAHSPKYWPANFVNFINTYGQDKVIFGTDFPVLDFERTRREIEALGLRPGPKQKLPRDNLVRLYKLDQRGVT